MVVRQSKRSNQQDGVPGQGRNNDGGDSDSSEEYYRELERLK
jgi:hypothetical protein